MIRVTDAIALALAAQEKSPGGPMQLIVMT